MVGFTEGCLTMARWDQLSAFFKHAGAEVILGLNALNGCTIPQWHGPAVGAWDSKNAESLIRYTISKNYNILGWEFGNELSRSGVHTRVAAGQDASDTVRQKNLVLDIYKSIEPKPLILAPGGSYDALWFREFLDKTPKSLDAITLHIYNLGSGSKVTFLRRPPAQSRTNKVIIDIGNGGLTNGDIKLNSSTSR